MGSISTGLVHAAKNFAKFVQALDAADYAAYSTVYGYGGYAVNDPDAFAPEHGWQVSTLKTLLAKNAVVA
mgnify:CR=1 FL=1